MFSSFVVVIWNGLGKHSQLLVIRKIHSPTSPRWIKSLLVISCIKQWMCLWVISKSWRAKVILWMMCWLLVWLEPLRTMQPTISRNLYWRQRMFEWRCPVKNRDFCGVRWCQSPSCMSQFRRVRKQLETRVGLGIRFDCRAYFEHSSHLDEYQRPDWATRVYSADYSRPVVHGWVRSDQQFHEYHGLTATCNRRSHLYWFHVPLEKRV